MSKSILDEVREEVDKALKTDVSPDKSPIENAKEKTSGIRSWLEEKLGSFWGGFIVGALNALLAVYIFSKLKGLEICPEKWKKTLETDMDMREYAKSAVATVVSAYLVSVVIYLCI